MNKAASIFKASVLISSGCFLYLLNIPSAFAQAQPRGRVEVVKDSRIDTLMARRYTPWKQARTSGAIPASSNDQMSEAARDNPSARVNTSPRVSSNANYTTNGYRVQFFSGSNRGEAFRAQAQFQKRYPELRTYMTYKEPNFKVKAGDFRSRMEAVRLVQQLRPQFGSLFIMNEKINAQLEPITP